jgi:hypothetical protein
MNAMKPKGGRVRGTPSEELDRQVAKVISAEDSCRVALECRKQKNSHPRVLAIVCPKSPATQMECALFVMKARMFSSKLLIRNIIPILTDFHAEMGGETTLVIRYAKKSKTKQVTFVNSSADELGAFIRVASSACQIASMHNFTVASLLSGQSHSWLLSRYMEEEHAIKNVLWIMNKQQQQPASGGGSLPTSPRPVSGGVRAEPENDTEMQAQRMSSVLCNPVMISFMTGAARTEWIQKQLMEREEEFTELRPVSLRLCSWNVGTRQPPPGAQLQVCHYTPHRRSIQSVVPSHHVHMQC